MGSRSCPRGAILHCVLVCLHVSNEFREGICWKILRGNDRTRGLDDKPERREIGNGVIRGLFVERLTSGMSAAVADDELIAIGWGFCHPQGAESTARAGRIFYNNLLTQFLAQALRNNTPGDIARATR